MKKLVRSVFDPSPRSLSVKNLAAVVGIVTCGIGVSVHEYLESGRPITRPACSSSVDHRSCKRELPSIQAAPNPVFEATSSPAPSAPTEGGVGEPRRTLSSARSSAASSPAPTQWTPESGASEGREEGCPGAAPAAEPGRIGSVSSW